MISWCFTTFYHGFTMVLPWFYHGFTMVLPWFYHGLPCFSHGFPMVFMVFSHPAHKGHSSNVNLRSSAGWIQEMTADGDTTRRLCDELAKQMGELISQAAPTAGRVFPWKMVV